MCSSSGSQLDTSVSEQDERVPARPFRTVSTGDFEIRAVQRCTRSRFEGKSAAARPSPRTALMTAVLAPILPWKTKTRPFDRQCFSATPWTGPAFFRFFIGIIERLSRIVEDIANAKLCFGGGDPGVSLRSAAEPGRPLRSAPSSAARIKKQYERYFLFFGFVKNPHCAAGSASLF